MLKAALEGIGYAVDWKDCNGNVCRSAEYNPAIFTTANLAQYDVIFFSNASGSTLFEPAERAAIIDFVQKGGGIGANHGAVDMGAASVTWDWWDGTENSVVGTTMNAHAATDITNVATVQVADHTHLATKRSSRHVRVRRRAVQPSSATSAARITCSRRWTRRRTRPGRTGSGRTIRRRGASSTTAPTCRTARATPKRYTDGRAWTTTMGHFGANYTENGGDNALVKQIVGGIRWLAGEGNKSDCSGTVWSSYSREVLVSNTNGAIAVDVAEDGKVYWSEIGSNADGTYPAYSLTGYVRVHDPKGAAEQQHDRRVDPGPLGLRGLRGRRARA